MTMTLEPKGKPGRDGAPAEGAAQSAARRPGRSILQGVTPRLHR